MHRIVPPGDLLWCGLGELWQLQRRADEAQTLGVEAREERAAPVTEEGDGRHLRRGWWGRVGVGVRGGLWVKHVGRRVGVGVDG